MSEQDLTEETPNAATLDAFAELENGGGYHFIGSTEELFIELLS